MAEKVSRLTFLLLLAFSPAGCDELDSDGNGFRDDCEDRFPPGMVLRDAEIFRCDENDTSRLCYDKTVFSSILQVTNFLEFQVPPTDDCASTERLNVEIEYERGSCRDTVYKLTPAQDISECNGREPVVVGNWTIPYENPLRGASREVSVALDTEAPVVQCGFRPDSASINEVDGQTLYHYMLRTDREGRRLSDARLFYEVTVSYLQRLLLVTVPNLSKLKHFFFAFLVLVRITARMTFTLTL